MGATSVTGVGHGAADKPGVGNKGSEHMSLAVHRLIGPRVVMCEDVTLDEAGNATVYYPTLVGTTDLYCIFLSTNAATAPYWGSFTTSSFTITGAADSTVCWQIVKHGLWGSPTTGLENS